MLITDPLAGSPEKKATRDGYGDALLQLGEMRTDVVVCDADLSGSTKTKPFSKKYPDRFYNFGVAEQNMLGNASGLAKAGLVPFASTFAMFLTGRAWEVVRNTIAYPGDNVKLVATHSGITLGEDGASHQALEDIGIMRVIPGLKVIVPADYHQTIHAVKAAAEIDGPVYIRLGRPNVPMLYSAGDEFEIGKAHMLQEGEKIAFFATGIMVYEAWKAARLLEKEQGIRPYVINFSTIKPLDSEIIRKILPGLERIYTFEEHNIIGGLGSAVAETVSELGGPKVTRFGIDDAFGQSGTPQGLMEHYRLTAEELVARIKTA